jgi:hypothetical protein
MSNAALTDIRFEATVAMKSPATTQRGDIRTAWKMNPEIVSAISDLFNVGEPTSGAAFKRDLVAWFFCWSRIGEA